MMKSILLSFFLFSCSFLLPVRLSAQSGDKKADKYYMQATERFKAGDAAQAMALLDKAEALAPRFSLLYLLRADIYNKTGERDKEIGEVEKALGIDSLKARPYYYLVLAEGYFDRGEYEKARDGYRLYLDRDKRLQAALHARKRLDNCDFALKALAGGMPGKVELYLEAELPVYWPSLDVVGQTLLFTEQDGMNERLWMQRGQKRYLLDFNPGGNVGAPSLTADGRVMYFTMLGGKCGNVSRGDIYMAYRLTDTTWSDPISLGAPVNTDAWEAQPSVSANGTKLYFASNREGGCGGSDIWVSRLLGQEAGGRQRWSKPVNLYFNTPGDEMAPFIYFDNRTLFFSSDNYPGMGRKDIYKADLKKAAVPRNVGVTVNTWKDEFGFMVDAGGEWGYFASDVSGRKKIYRYRLEDSVKCTPASYISIRTTDPGGMPLWPDKLTVTGVVAGDTLAYYAGGLPGATMLACVPSNTLLLVSAIKKGYMYYSDTLQMKVADIQSPQVEHIVLSPIREGNTLVLKGVFFDVDDYHLRPESRHELQQVVDFMKMNPLVKIEISGHTDNTGGDAHNYKLSEDRAYEVYKFLFVNRIDKDRMSYKGYGKDVPLAPNGTEQGRSVNRRTEIKISKE